MFKTSTKKMKKTQTSISFNDNILSSYKEVHSLPQCIIQAVLNDWCNEPVLSFTIHHINNEIITECQVKKPEFVSIINETLTNDVKKNFIRRLTGILIDKYQDKYICVFKTNIIGHVKINKFTSKATFVSTPSFCWTIKTGDEVISPLHPTLSIKDMLHTLCDQP